MSLFRTWILVPYFERW